MLKTRSKSIITLVIVFILCTCIDPYSPKLAGYESLLVVDGLITDANTSYTIKLSRTFQEQNTPPEWVSDATILITDDSGNSSYLVSRGNGIYKTDSMEFKGIAGRTYMLHILTPKGDEYESEPCKMQSVPDIDSIYFAKDQILINNGTQSQEGVSIYLDSKDGDNNQYLRWAYDETWKFRAPYPKKYNYIDSATIVLVDKIREFCWKSRKSDEILIYSNYSGQAASIKKKPIFFIAPDQSDRLLIQYSILVKQYSISKEEYDFWNNMKQINESGGDIFAKQPFTVSSNIHNVNDPKERVLGYFMVSALKQKRKNIRFKEIVEMKLPYFHYKCERIVKAPSDYYSIPPTTFDQLYSIFCITSDYYFVEPIWGISGLEKLVFTRPECANCEFTGTSTKPDFWVDLN